jgi:hypothetical protein
VGLCDRPFRWQRVSEGLHAISNATYREMVFPGDEITTLCGRTGMLTRADYTPKLPSGQPVPTCSACSSAWLEYESRTAKIKPRRA